MHNSMVHPDSNRMNWKHEDTTSNWLKVRSEAGRAYFILREQDPAFLAIDLLPVIPADPSESNPVDRASRGRRVAMAGAG